MKQCKFCNKQITKRYNIFCSPSCAYSFNNRQRIPKAPKEPGNCKQCDKKLSHHWKTFCNTSCSCSYSNLHRAPRSVESCRKQSEKMKQQHKENPEAFSKFRRGGSLATTNKRKSPTLSICATCQVEFESRYTKVTCSRRCLGKHLSLKNLDKIGTGFSKSGTYQNIKCQSTYELAFVIWALDNQLPIQRCRIRIPYFYEGKDRYYNPDFEIAGKIYEIKGYVTEITQVKLTAAENSGIEVIVIGNQNIRKYLEHVKTMHGIDVTKDYALFYTK
jgi:hypothetical protein